MPRALVLVAAVLFGALVNVSAQKIHPALQSQEAFFAEIQGKKWETSFTSYPRIRFEKDRIEFIDDNGKVTGQMTKVSYPEPGQVRTDFKDGSFHLFVFSDDLETFAIVNTLEASQFNVEGATGPVKLPAAATDTPLTLTFIDNPFWKSVRLHADKLEVLDGSGAVFATNPSFAYSPLMHGVDLKEKQAGAVVLSRAKPGSGWYMRGRNLGTGLRTDVAGPFRMFLRTHLSRFQLRSAHFIYPLLLAGKEQLATAQERYAVKLNIDGYGESSDKVARCLHEMGKLRRYARSYARSAELHKEALAHAKTSLAADKPALLDLGTDLAASQNDAGDFAGAKATLAEAQAHLPDAGAKDSISGIYFFYDALASAEFGLRNYPQAARLLTENLKRVQDAGYKSNMITTLLNLVPCHLALGQAAQAEACLRQAMDIQDQWQKENPNYNFETWKLAFTCVALGKNQEAVKYSPVYKQRRNWVGYEEYGRLVSLFHGGDRAAAQDLAKNFVERFNNIKEINIRDDMDPITVALTLAIANPTPDAVTALEQLWAAQVDSLRNRPLKNYIFARVMVLTLAKLKAGR